MIKGEELLRVRRPQEAKQVLSELLASQPDTLWQQGIKNLIELAEKPEERGRLIPFVWLRWGNQVNHVDFSPDGRLLAICSVMAPIILWNVETRRWIKSFQDKGSSAVFSPDGKLMAYKSGKDIKFLSIADQKTTTIQEAGAGVTSLAFSPDGESLASGMGNGMVKLWNISEKKEMDSLSGHTKTVRMLAFHPDGKLLASGSKDGAIKIWDVIGRKEVMTLGVDSESRAPRSIPRTEQYRNLLMSIWSVAFSPDGELIAATSGDNVIAIWRVGSWEQMGTMEHPEVVSVAFSPNSKVLASCSDSWTMVLWDVETRQPLAVKSGGQGEYIGAVAFSPDGKTLASGSEYGLKLWALYPAVGGDYRPVLSSYENYVITNPDQRFFPSQKTEEDKSSTVPQDPNEIAEIEIIIDNFVEGYNRWNVDMLMSSISPAFSGAGKIYSELRKSVESRFADYKAKSKNRKKYEVELKLQSVEVTLTDKGARATSMYERIVESSPDGRFSASGPLIFELSKETGHWRIIRITGFVNPSLWE